jgi:manganese-dependent inorganic pyrophosphatase
MSGMSEARNPQTIYVVGHANPDMDSIAAALGYAWLLRERDAAPAEAARAGALNAQSAWTLERLGLEPPRLLTDASPRFESVMRRLDTTAPDQPLRDAWAIASRTGGVVPVVNADGTPYGLVTGWSIFKFLTETIGPHPRGQEKPMAEVLDAPCRAACSTDVAAFKAKAHIRDSLNRILRMEPNDFFVLDDEGRYLGVTRQRDLLNPPRLRLILVDHNEPSQSVGSVDEAELLEVLDHHRLGNAPTHMPIRFTVDVVGSTCTLVTERIEEAGLSAPPEVAGLLLAGLVSDTLQLTSPTTTPRDHRAAERLGRWAFAAGGPLKGESLESFGQAVIAAGAGLEARDPDEIVNGDLKTYEAGGMKFAIAQVEVTKFHELEEFIPPLVAALDRLRDKKGLDFAMLMITNVVRASSRLLVSGGAPAALDELPYPPHRDGSRAAEGLVSRKKQLLPVVLGLLEN